MADVARPRGRNRGTDACVLDAIWLGALVVIAPGLGMVIVAVALLLPAALAMRYSAIGAVLVFTRGLAAAVLLAAAVSGHWWAGLLAVAAGGAAALGLQDALTRRQTPEPEARPGSERRDAVGATAIHFAFIGLIAGALLLERRYLAALGFVALWIAITWFPLAVHEAGHALTAKALGYGVGQVHVGVGLQLFRIGNVSVGSVPLLGETHWRPDGCATTRRHYALIILGGPLANIVTGVALLIIPAVRSDVLGILICAGWVFTGFCNLIPHRETVNGRVRTSDGAMLQQLRAHDDVEPTAN